MLLSDIPASPLSDVLIVASEADRRVVRRLQSIGFVVHSVELLLTGALRQKLDLTAFALPPLSDENETQKRHEQTNTATQQDGGVYDKKRQRGAT